VTMPTASGQVLSEAGVPETGRPARQNQVKLRLEIVAGAHRGAALVLEEGVHRVGSSSDADIVLSDPGVAPAHAMLDVGRDMLTGRSVVRIGATGGDVVVGREKLPLSRGCRARLPVSITLGETRIQLSESRTGGAGRGDIRKTLVGVAVGTAVAVAVAVAAQAFRASGSADMGASERLSSDEPPGSSVADASDPSGAFDSAAEEAVRALDARLVAAKITTLRISAENGRLAATGVLAGQQQAAEWAAIQRWFDQTYGGRLVLTIRLDQPSAPRAMPTLRLQAVWYGERPYLLAADGEHYFKGAILDNGWIIRDIGEDHVLLAKEGETVTLTYGLSSPQASALPVAPTNE
jgi:Inner membrane component of T3SS, cytoplasmic domain/Inner membrane component of T3SS, periplasmic domain